MLEASHLKKIYETGSGKVYALDDVSFSVETGEFVAILGPSGCGKSTLLHILGGVDEPTEGEVCLDGNEYTKFLEKEKDALRRQKIGMIYQAWNDPRLHTERRHCPCGDHAARPRPAGICRPFYPLEQRGANREGKGQSACPRD